MRILIVSYFYRPDVRPGSFRATALVEALRELAPAETQIDVITTHPRRAGSAGIDAPLLERQPGLSIFRIALPERQIGMANQAIAFGVFARNALLNASPRYDLVFATSGRLMTAVLGAWLARRTGARLYLDIRDIFVEGIAELLPRGAGSVAQWLSSALERWTVGYAAKVNLVSAGFADYFTQRYPKHSFSFITHGVDAEFVAAAATMPAALPMHAGDGVAHVVYAGNVGEGQGLHHIIPGLAARMGSRLRFTVVGDGNSKHALEAAIAAAGAGNVTLVPPMMREALLEVYRSADVLFVHLNDFAAFRKVLPSKLFECAALGKPLWAGVAGYPAQFIRAEIPNAAVFAPCDVDAAVRCFADLKLEPSPRPEFLRKYDRVALSCELARDILSVAQQGSDD